MMKLLLSAFAGLVAFLAFVASGPAGAQQAETPYWATIDTTELNMRVGPSIEYKIEWVFRREGLPIKVLRKREGWRYIEDPTGAKGWVSREFLSAARGGLVTGTELVPMRAAPADNSAVKWNLEPGVVGKLGACEAGWCVFSVGRRSGYVPENRLWGAGAP